MLKHIPGVLKGLIISNLIFVIIASATLIQIFFIYQEPKDFIWTIIGELSSFVSGIVFLFFLVANLISIKKSKSNYSSRLTLIYCIFLLLAITIGAVLIYLANNTSLEKSLFNRIGIYFFAGVSLLSSFLLIYFYPTQKSNPNK